MVLGQRAFAFWHDVARRFVAEPSGYGIRVGASSRDIRLVAEPGFPVTENDVTAAVARFAG